MAKDPASFVRELLSSVGSSAFESMLMRGEPRGFSSGERLIATEDIPAMILFDHGMASGNFDVVIPQGTLVEYRGGSPYSAFMIALPDEVHKSLGPAIFGRHQWLVPLPTSAYTIEVLNASAIKFFKRTTET